MKISGVGDPKILAMSFVTMVPMYLMGKRKAKRRTTW
jgi:hypothetical protein